MSEGDKVPCCKCGEEVDTADASVPPKWFGAYEGQKMTKVICAGCLAKERSGKRMWSVE